MLVDFVDALIKLYCFGFWVGGALTLLLLDCSLGESIIAAIFWPIGVYKIIKRIMDPNDMDESRRRDAESKDGKS